MRNFNIVDIETFNDKGRFVPYCICLILNEEEVVFYGNFVVEKMIRWFEKKKVKETFYAHNLTFDGSIIIENIKEVVKIKGVLFRSNIYEIKIWSKDFEILIKCSYRMFPLSLKKIGKLLKIEREKTEFPHEFAKEENLYYIGDHPVHKNWKNWDFKKEASKYCMNDCYITKKMLEEINLNMENDEKNIFKKSRSISSFSLNIFKEKFNKLNAETRILLKNDEMIRQGFYGGRCEVFGNVERGEKVFHFDFTGMYSEIMKDNFHFNKAKVKKVSKMEKPGFYTVDVFSDGMDIPVLPFKEKKEGKLIFPNGRWTGTYWYEELKEFEKEGGSILKIHNMVEFQEKGEVFKDFIENYSRLRKKSEIDNVFWKLFVNSIYGRLGMQENKEQTSIVYDEGEYEKMREEKEIIRESLINKIRIITFEKERTNEELDSNVALAAQITSKARIKLFRAFKDVIKNGGRILYTDTDSIFASFKRDVSGEKHGEVFWDAEKDDTIIKDAIFALPKGYAIINNKNENIIKIKGFRRNSIDFEEFKSLFISNKEIKLKESNFKKSNFSLKFEEIEKSIRLNSYDKRIFNKNKTKTKALIVDKIEF